MRALIAFCLLAVPGFACEAPEEAQAMAGEGGGAFIALDPVALSKPFGLSLTFCDAPVQAARVDAIMPAHQHGMNYQPKVAETGPGQFAAEGLVFHMPGLWQIRVEAETPSGTQTYTLDHMLR